MDTWYMAFGYYFLTNKSVKDNSSYLIKQRLHLTNNLKEKIITMKRKKLLLTGFIAAVILTGGIIYAADHIDAPAVTNQTTDITDLYVFRGQDINNLVFVANTQGLLTPGAATTAAKFDPNALIEFNIDINNDNKEDLLIQGVYDAASNKIKIYGPAAASEQGTRSKLEGAVTSEVLVTANGSAAVTSTGPTGIKVFAGPRDDPFFFDLTRYKAILAGTATGFRTPGVDDFAGKNVMSVVVEVPKSLLGTVASGKINVWLETKKKI